jgi:hypothetical protein
LCNKDFHNLCSSYVINRVIISTRIRWARYVARRAGYEKIVQIFYLKKSKKEKGRDLRVDVSVICERLLRKHDGADGVHSTGAG